MAKKNAIGDCIAKLEVDSPGYHFVWALREIHQNNKNYGLVPVHDVTEKLPLQARYILADPENCVLDRLLDMNIIELNFEDWSCRIHPEHQIIFKDGVPF